MFRITSGFLQAKSMMEKRKHTIKIARNSKRSSSLHCSALNRRREETGDVRDSPPVISEISGSLNDLTRSKNPHIVFETKWDYRYLLAKVNFHTFFCCNSVRNVIFHFFILTDLSVERLWFCFLLSLPDVFIWLSCLIPNKNSLIQSLRLLLMVIRAETK